MSSNQLLTFIQQTPDWEAEQLKLLIERVLPASHPHPKHFLYYGIVSDRKAFSRVLNTLVTLTALPVSEPGVQPDPRQVVEDT